MSNDLADRIAAKRREIEASGFCQWGYRAVDDKILLVTVVVSCATCREALATRTLPETAIVHLLELSLHPHRCPVDAPAV